MGERVRTGGCRKFRRQTEREFGIENNKFCQQRRVKKDRFATSCLERDDRAASNFTPGAGSCRNGNKRRESRPIWFIIKPGEIQSGSSHQRPRRFPDIQRAAAANGNDSIATMLAELRCGFADVFLKRIWVDTRVNKPVQALPCFPQYPDQGAKCAGV